MKDHDRPRDDPTEPRVKFNYQCKRCGFYHVEGKACPRCADTLAFDTRWFQKYEEPGEEITVEDSELVPWTDDMVSDYVFDDDDNWVREDDCE